MPHTAADVARHLRAKQSESKDGWLAKCPAHDDKRASLSIGEGADGTLLLNCHAGCSFEQIVAKLPASSSRGTNEATVYTYQDERGEVVLEVVRTSDKRFWQRRPDGRGGHTTKDATRGVPEVPYRLPALREAITRRAPFVFLAEGEKDVDNLRALGLPATTFRGGAARVVPASVAAYFAGASCVVVLPDNDAPGRTYAERNAAMLHSAGVPVKLLALPDLPPKGDVTNWLEAGGTSEKLVALAQAAPSWSAPNDADLATDAPDATEGARAPVRLDALLSNPALLEPPPAAVPNFAYRSRVTLCDAREKFGKSTLAGQVVAAYSCGAASFDGCVLTPGVALIYQIDEPLGDTVRRLRAHGADPRRVFHSEEAPSPERMAADIAATGATLVVVDVLAALAVARGVESLRDEGEVPRFVRPYVLVARRTGAALVLLHHSLKSGLDYSGSVQLGAAVDLVLSLRPTRAGEAPGEESAPDDGSRLLIGKGRGIQVRLRLSFDGTRYSIGEAGLPLARRVLLELVEAGGSATAIAKRLGRRKDAVLEELSALHAAGLVYKREGQRPWALTASGERAAAGEPVPKPVPEGSANTQREPVPGTGFAGAVMRSVPGGTTGNQSGTAPEPVPGTTGPQPVPALLPLGRERGTGGPRARVRRVI